MKKLDICFAKEYNSKKAAIQLKIISKLEDVLPKRIAEKFNDVQIRIRISTSQRFDISGFDDKEKKLFLEYLEDLWSDSSLLDGIEE